MGFPITGRMNHEHAHRASSAGGIIDALKESVILDIKDGPGYVWAEHLISWAFVHFFQKNLGECPSCYGTKKYLRHRMNEPINAKPPDRNMIRRLCDWDMGRYPRNMWRSGKRIVSLMDKNGRKFPLTVDCPHGIINQPVNPCADGHALKQAARPPTLDCRERNAMKEGLCCIPVKKE